MKAMQPRVSRASLHALHATTTISNNVFSFTMPHDASRYTQLVALLPMPCACRKTARSVVTLSALEDPVQNAAYAGDIGHWTRF